MPKVFVVQNQHRWDADQSRFVPKFDFSSASSFGELVDLVSPSAGPFRPQPLVEEMRAALQDFCDDDHLLLVGNPVLIGIAFSLAADANEGRVRVLQWSREDGGRYLSVCVKDLFELEQRNEDPQPPHDEAES